MLAPSKHTASLSMSAIFCALLLLGCGTGDGKPYELPKTVARPAATTEGLKDKNIPYRFDKPMRKLKLSPQLRETSALTVIDDKHVATEAISTRCTSYHWKYRPHFE